MNTTLLYAASIATTVTALAHVFVGGPQNAEPVLQQKDLPNGPRATVEFAWHAASVLLMFVAASYFWAAATGKGQILVIFVTIQCITLAGLCTFIALRRGVPLTSFPPLPLFTLISVLGVLALWT